MSNIINFPVQRIRPVPRKILHDEKCKCLTCTEWREMLDYLWSLKK